MSVAIIGMAGRFPKSENINDFWDNLVNARDCITRSDTLYGREGAVEFVHAYGKLDNIYSFDNALFHISDAEAEAMEPQERQLLECSYLALQDAGYASEDRKETTGIICGAPENEYYLVNRFYGEKKNAIEAQNEKFHHSGGALAGRIAYKLNLTGPAIKIDTACSTSLSSVILAADMINMGYADMMIAGGSNIDIRQDGYVHIEGMSSEDGVVRPFDKNSTGMVPGNGVGAVILKKYEAAIRDKDYIYAVIKGGYICNDGKDKIGYTAPCVTGEVRAIEGALHRAGTDRDNIDYIETHGTATVLGDAIELKGIKRVFQRSGDNRLPVGSLKGNFGHLNMAAGIASVIKGCLMLERQLIPPSINNSEPNSEISDKEHIFIPKEPIRKEIKNIGISSFGLGGMNSHMILSRCEENGDVRKHTKPVILHPKEFISKTVSWKYLNGEADEKKEEKHIITEERVWSKSDNNTPVESEIRKKLIELVRAETGNCDFDGTQSLEECGIESMEQIVISSKIADEFKVTFTMKDFYCCEHIDDLVAMILTRKNSFLETTEVQENEPVVEEFDDIDDLFKEF